MLCTLAMIMLVAVELPSGPGAMAPYLVQHDDVVLMSWLEQGEDATSLRFARFNGDMWSAPTTIVERDDFFANWADVPMICPIDDNSIVAFWLQKAGPGTYAYLAVSARSDDSGETWRTIGPVHDDFSETEHGFIAPIAMPDDDAVRAFWLDGRGMSGDGHGHDGGDMQLRTTVLRSLPAPSVLLDNRVCECCNTAAAMTDNGPIVLYRDRSDDEVRDISIVRSVNGEWTVPKTIHEDGWGITACPVNGPAVDARGNHVVVAWYSGVGDSGVVRVAFSDDGGESFSEPVDLDTTFPVGRTDVLLLDDGTAIVSWLDDVGGLPPGGAIRMGAVGRDGPMTPVRSVATAAIGRHTGFPRMARVGDRVLIVWTEGPRPTQLRSTTIPLN